MTVCQAGIRIKPYWSLDASYELQLPSVGAYTDAFREVFTQAVHSRLRSAFPVGSYLSGGLDSSSVTCVARHLLIQQAGRLHTFSSVFDDVPQCDERSFIEIVLNQGGVIPHYVHADQCGPLDDLQRVFWYQDEPILGPNSFLTWGMNQAAQREGVRVVLDGFDGDTTVSHGATYFAELVHQGQWDTLVAEIKDVSRHFQVSPHVFLQHCFFPYLEELARRGRWVRFAAVTQQLKKYCHVSRWHLLRDQGLKTLASESIRLARRAWPGHQTSMRGADTLINPSFARDIGLSERIRTFSRTQLHLPLTVREDQWRYLTSGLLAIVLELSDRCAAAFSLEARHPFMDKRLIEFCLALPPEQKRHQGWDRVVMRRAMTTILPEQVQWRVGKADMHPNFMHGLLTFDRELLDQAIMHNSMNLKRYVNVSALQEIYLRLRAQATVRVDEVMALWRVVTLSHWLQCAAMERVVS